MYPNVERRRKRMAALRILGLVVFLTTAQASLWAQQHTAVSSKAGSISATASSSDAAGSDQSAFAQRNPRYQLQGDDVLAVSFPLSPELDEPKVMVQPDGYLTLQGAESLHVQGLTVPEAVEAVKKAYATKLHDPIVEIDLIDFQRAYFVVLGQVNKPGQYDLRYDITVIEAVAMAGGFAPTAKTQVLLYHRAASGWVESRQLKLKDILHGKNVSEDVSMRAGDMLFVPEKAITRVRKYIPYGIGTSLNAAGLN
jgi:polysaccharide export outer membrane protein